MKLWKFLCLSVLACTVFYCSKDSDLISTQQSNPSFVTDSKTELKLKLKENIGKVLSFSVALETLKDSAAIRNHQDQISAINETVSYDLIELSKVLSESELLSFIDNEVFVANSSSASTPCFDEYSRSYFRAVRELVVCSFFTPGFDCVHDYVEEFYAATHEYENCIQETYYSEK